MSEGPVKLYETLARYQWWRRKWSRAAPGEHLELRKRLSSAADAPADSGEALDRWLYALAGPPSGARLLDLGCGFGASLLRWVEWSGGTGIGTTSSPFQVARATMEATRRGLAPRCRFAVQDFAVPIATDCDAVLAIESLGHASDLAAVLANVHAALASRGRFVWVEDLLRGPLSDDRDVLDLAQRWVSPPLREVATARRALAEAGLTIVQEHDLTERVAPTAEDLLRRRESRLRRYRALVPWSPWRRLFDAFLGGCCLERLYARGHACYLVFVCERTGAPS